MEKLLEEMNVHDKMKYFDDQVRPGLANAFARGEKYKGGYHFAADKHLNRGNEEDVRHVRELHVDVRLREAEDIASIEHAGTPGGILAKIESAIGYLIILHMRIKVRAEVAYDD